MGRTRNAGVTIAVVLSFALACGGGDGPAAPRYALQARVGTYNDGSGRLGLTLLATVRGADGLGPVAPLPVSVRDGDGAVALATEYAASAEGSYLAVWRPDVAPSAGAYEVVATDGADTLAVAPTLALTSKVSYAYDAVRREPEADRRRGRRRAGRWRLDLRRRDSHAVAG
jgi:hypothetical protein